MSTTTSTPETIERAFAGYAPGEDKPLGGYAILMATFTSLAGLFAAWFGRSGRELPERIDARDLALITLASHKASRLIAKDRVAAPVRAPFTRLEGEGG